MFEGLSLSSCSSLCLGLSHLLGSGLLRDRLLLNDFVLLRSCSLSWLLLLSLYLFLHETVEVLIHLVIIEVLFPRVVSFFLVNEVYVGIVSLAGLKFGYLRSDVLVVDDVSSCCALTCGLLLFLDEFIEFIFVVSSVAMVPVTICLPSLFLFDD